MINEKRKMKSQRNHTSYNTISEAYLGTLEDIYVNGKDDSGFSQNDYKNIKNDESKLETYDGIDIMMYETQTDARRKKIIADPIMENENYYFNRAKCRELIDYSFTIVKPSITEDIITKSEKYNEIMRKYSMKETELFDKGDIFNMGTISKVWDKIKNPDGSINANYGYMVYHLKDAHNKMYGPNDKPQSQWEWAKDMLIRNKNTCQAYCHFNRPKDQWKGNLDQPCTMFIQFLIRDDELHLLGFMRSNDIVYGTPYNILYFVKLMYRMIDELKDVYPNLVIGNYVHHVTSIHYYKRSADRVKQMIGL